MSTYRDPMSRFSSVKLDALLCVLELPVYRDRGTSTLGDMVM